MTDSSERVTVHVWSGPRCVSTSLMYSWAQREDCAVLDEPLYAAYLKQTGIVHPGLEEVCRLTAPLVQVNIAFSWCSEQH